MFVLDHIALDEEIITQPFACDLRACKGACCTMEGGTGAPLRESEIASVEHALPAAMRHLSEESQEYIRRNGWLAGPEGDRTVNCIDDAQCVFVVFEESIAKCALERAYFHDESTFRKPISCHLFPIRVADFGGPYLYYDRFPECAPAVVNGERSHQRIVDTCHDALVREYGEEWTDALRTLDDTSLPSA
ncbi:MAG: DUF3109 family protein [Candidatus Kapaibacterium sp.]